MAQCPYCSSYMPDGRDICATCGKTSIVVRGAPQQDYVYQPQSGYSSVPTSPYPTYNQPMGYDVPPPAVTAHYSDTGKMVGIFGIIMGIIGIIPVIFLLNTGIIFGPIALMAGAFAMKKGALNVGMASFILGIINIIIVIILLTLVAILIAL